MMSLPVGSLAETPMPDDFLCDPPVDSKRYAIDPSDSAFNVMTSQYQTKHSYGYRGSSCSTPMALCRQASNPGSFQEANRNGEAARETLKKTILIDQEQCIFLSIASTENGLKIHMKEFATNLFTSLCGT